MKKYALLNIVLQLFSVKLFYAAYFHNIDFDMVLLNVLLMIISFSFEIYMMMLAFTLYIAANIFNVILSFSIMNGSKSAVKLSFIATVSKFALFFSTLLLYLMGYEGIELSQIYIPLLVNIVALINLMKIKSMLDPKRDMNISLE